MVRQIQVPQDAVVLDEAPPTLWALLRAEPALQRSAFLALVPQGAEAFPAEVDACLRKPVDAAALARGLAELAAELTRRLLGARVIDLEEHGLVALHDQGAGYVIGHVSG